MCEYCIGTKVGFWTSLIWLYLFAVYIVTHKMLNYQLSQVLYMSFDRFLLTVESRDLSQDDKSIITLSFKKLQDWKVNIILSFSGER